MTDAILPFQCPFNTVRIFDVRVGVLSLADSREVDERNEVNNVKRLAAIIASTQCRQKGKNPSYIKLKAVTGKSDQVKSVRSHQRQEIVPAPSVCKEVPPHAVIAPEPLHTASETRGSVSPGVRLT